jgi:type II secretory pathway component GspD/PulD (secretin)
LKQKKALLVETALRNAQALRDQGEYEGARRQLEEAMKHDPANADVTAQYLEILELLGERVGEIGTVRRVAEERSKVRREALRAEAEEYHRLATEAMERGDFDESIRYFERVQDSIRWSSLGVEWGDLPARNEASLEEATSARDSATEEQRQDKLREAFDRIREDERQQAQQRADQVATLLEKAASKYERGEFDSAIELCDQALLAESSNKTALDLRDESIDARRKGRQAQHREERAEAYRQFMRRIDELRIPYSDSLTPAPEDYWNQVLRRTSTTELNLDAVQSPEDQRLRELVKTTRVPEIHFEDDEIGTVTTVLQNITGIPMIATNELITDLDSSGELVSLPTLTNLSVASILDIIATTLGEDYSWTVRHGVVMFTTKEDAYGDTVIRTHPIQDLTFPLTNFKGPQIDKISLQGQYGDDPETSVFASDLEGEVIINPEDIVNLIRENVARESWDLEDKFSIDVAASNQILVIHTPQVHAEIAAFLDDLRRFSSTVVEIESRFIEITDAFIQEIGADFRGLGGVFGSNVTLDDTPVGIGTDPEFSNGLDNLGSGVAGADSPSAGIFFNDNTDGDIRGRTENFFADPLGNLLSTIGGGSFQFSLLDDTQLNLVVTAIEKSADATEVMSPILTVFNTERAYVSVINEVSFLQDFDVDVANTAFIANPEIGILQEGVVLDVQPTISYDRKYITLEVRTTVATIDRPIPTFETTLAGFTDAVTFQLPTLEVQNAATTVRVPDGGSVILGGLNSIRHINRRAEVPWISEIPLLGFFFREKGVVDEVSSLVILMRAQIRDLSPYREALPLR